MAGLIGLSDFPFVEVKVDRKFIAGCADDRLKRAMCGRILDLANFYGALLSLKGSRRERIFWRCARWGSIWSKAFCLRSLFRQRNSRGRLWGVP
jgi:hypothetical protein